MHEVSRLLQAAAALSQILRDAGVPHAFHGNVLTAVLSKAPLADVCHVPKLVIVERSANVSVGNMLHS